MSDGIKIMAFVCLTVALCVSFIFAPNNIPIQASIFGLMSLILGGGQIKAAVKHILKVN